jgi:hypothetical protein
MNVLQGSTSASIGIKLADFSALNLINDMDPSSETVPTQGYQPTMSGLNKTVRAYKQHTGEVWIDSSPIQAKHKILVPPVEAISRPSTPAAIVIEIDNTSSRHGDHNDLGSRSVSVHSGAHFQIPKPMRHLTPPEKFTRPDLFASRPSAGTFPRLARIPHWRRGRKELVEDVLEEMGKGMELDGVLDGMRNLGLWEMEVSLHKDRIRRESEDSDWSLLQTLGRSERGDAPHSGQ